MDCQSTKQAHSQVSKCIKVPFGHIIVNDKWNGTELLTVLSRNVQVIALDALGIVDFFPSSDTAIIYITEADMIAGSDYRRKLVKLRKADYARGLVIAEKTHLSAQYFFSLQKFTVLELGLGILPVSGQTESAQLLSHLVYSESKAKSNPFLLKHRLPPLQVCILHTLLKVPSLGEVKAQALLENFKCLEAIGLANIEDLEKVIGHSSAVQVYNFFHSQQN